MIHVLAFRPEHLAALDPQEAQRAQLTGDVLARGEALSVSGNCFTAFSATDGAMLMCGGSIETHGDYATMWSAFGSIAPGRLREMAAVRERTRWLLAMMTHRRIDAVVRVDHVPAHHWMKALGFVPEARLNDYFDDGGDAMISRLVR